MPSPVLESVVGHLELEARIGGYEAAAARREAVQGAYRDVASLLGSSPANVAFVENATAAAIQALSAIPWGHGDVLLTTRHDYVSNQIMYLSLAERRGVEVVRAPDCVAGGVDPERMEELIHRLRPRLVAVSWVPTSSGLVQPVAAIGEMCRREGVTYLVDACQAVGQMPVDVGEIGCDFLTATARKFLRGPRGAGFLYVSDRALEIGLEPLLPDMRGADWIEADLYQPVGDARRFENWEFSYALVLGMGEAARYALGLGLGAIQERSWSLAARLRDELETLDAVRVLDRGPNLCAIVTVHVEGHDPGDLVRQLRLRGVNTSSSTRPFAVMDFDDKGVPGALRLSPHYFNTEEELDEAVATIEELVSGAPEPQRSA